MPGKQKQAHGKPKSAAGQTSDRDVSTSKKATVAYTRVEEMPILRPNDPSGLALWLEAGQIYFRRTYQMYGRFFPSGERQQIPVPVRPRVAAAAVDGEEAGDADIRDNGSVNDSHSALGMLEVDSDSDDDDEQVTVVATEREADAIYADAIKSYNKAIAREKELRPAMYADIRANLSVESVEKLSEQPKFGRYHQDDNPYGMLRLILKVHGGAKTGWVVADSLDSKRVMFQLRQGKEESLLLYKNRFVAASKETSEFTAQELAIIFINNMNASNSVFQGDQDKLIALGKTDEYPATVELAFRGASKYKSSSKITGQVKVAGTSAATTLVAQASGKSSSKGQNSGGKAQNGGGSQKAAGSAKSGESPASGKAASGKTALKYPCSTCSLLGKPDDHTHFPNNCPHKDEVAKVLAAASDNRGTTMMATVGFDGIDLNESRASTRILLGANTIGEKVLRMSVKLKDDEIVLDNASTINLFGNSELLSGIANSSTLAVTGVGGDITVNQKGSFCNVFETNFHEHFDCNILAQARVEDVVKATPGASICYDPDSGDFEVNIPGSGFWRFARRDDLGGLRVATAYPEAAFITVGENRLKYTKRELRGADNAKEAIRRANFPSVKSMANLVNTGNILNSPITSSDAHRTIAIDGGVIPSEMGKGTKRKPTVLSEEPSTAVVDKDVHLGCDIFFVDGHAFLLTLSNFGYGMAAYLGLEKDKGTRSGANIWLYLSAMFAAYVAYGFNLVTFEVDKEPGIWAYKTQIQEKGMKFNPKSPDSKAPKPERRIRTIKERDRSPSI